MADSTLDKIVEFMATQSVDGVFHGSPIITSQMLAATRFRAAELAKPIVTAANLGRSYAVDSWGNIIYLSKNEGGGLLTGVIAIGQRKSWYNRVGDIPMLLGSLVLIASFTAVSLAKRIIFNF